VLELEPFSLFTSNRTELVVDDNKMPAMTGHRLLLFSFYFNLILFFIPAKQIQVFRCLSTNGRPFVFENVFFPTFGARPRNSRNCSFFLFVNKIPVDRGRLSAATPSDLPLDQEKKIPSTLMTSIVHIFLFLMYHHAKEKERQFFSGGISCGNF
jgi:hypothetical protein